MLCNAAFAHAFSLVPGPGPFPVLLAFKQSPFNSSLIFFPPTFPQPSSSSCSYSSSFLYNASLLLGCGCGGSKDALELLLQLLGIALEERHLFRVLLLVELAALEGKTNSQTVSARDTYWSYYVI